jgi:hypothetical protein
MITTQDVGQGSSRKAGSWGELGPTVTNPRGHMGTCRELLSLGKDLGHTEWSLG